MSLTAIWESSRKINTYAETVTVEYDEKRLVKYPYNLLDELELAYAITIHKPGKRISGGYYPFLTGTKTAILQKSALYGCYKSKKVCYSGWK